MQHLNEDMCIAHFTEGTEIDSQVNQGDSIPVLIHLTCANHRSYGLQVEDVYFGMHGYKQWLKMEPKHLQKNAQVLRFAAQTTGNCNAEDFSVYFDMQTVSTISNNYYEMMDDKWLTDLWMAAVNQKLTDVKIFVGSVKVMEAHRVILGARSPVLGMVLNKFSENSKQTISFEKEFDVDTVKQFLNFLYTGSLKSTEGGKQLSKLATTYQVETLKNVCQLMNRAPEVEELSD
jgi:hypothetical protein